MLASAGDLVSRRESRRAGAAAPARRRARGFNQAEELARHLGLEWTNVLRRTRATPSQTDLPAARRHANVRNAFALERRHAVDGLTVLLVDDVSHDRRDAERVRASCCDGRGAGSARAHRGASRVETAVSTSARTASRERSPSRRSHRRPQPGDGSSSRTRDKQREVALVAVAPGSLPLRRGLGRDVEQDASGPAPEGTLNVGQPAGRAPALRRRRCSRRCSDRR